MAARRQSRGRRPTRPRWTPLQLAAPLVAASLAAGLGGCSPAGGRAPARAGGAPTTAAAEAGGATTTAAAEPPPSSTSANLNPTPDSASDWTTYQNGNSRWGATAGEVATSPRQVWANALDGAAVYGQPLVFAGRIIAATEADDVFAVDATSGQTVWEVNLGAPTRNVAAQAGCGNVDPLGVTSTPVIDPATGTLYVVAEVSTAGAAPVHHQLFGIDTATGRITSSVAADPPLGPGEDALHLLQRTGLALGNGRVYIGYGGQYGDCGRYHGWLVAVPVSGGTPAAFDVTPQSAGGALWNAGAAPAIAADGSVFVSTGNPTAGGPSPWAEAVVELDPSADSPPRAAFQDKAATGDLDLATGSPVLLPGGAVFATGKTDVGFLLGPPGLSLQARIRGTICGSDPDGGSAFDQATDSFYLPCHDGGVQQVRLRDRTTGWRSGQANSTPILAGGEIWALHYPTGILQELDPVTGAIVWSSTLGHDIAHFAAPSAAGGRLYIPTTNGLLAFGR